MNTPREVDPIQGEILHEYDGIKEANNHLPTWWLWSFFGAIAFSVVYWFYYHTYEVGPLSMHASSAVLVYAAEKSGSVSEELLLGLVQDPTAVAQGKKIFDANCVVCHGAKGEGKIGPNLTDAYWIHGSKPLNLHETIAKGVAAKGMPAWGPALGAKSVREVTAFALTLRGRNLPGKAPEGQAEGESAP